MKAQTLYHYCGRATRRLIERDYVRKALEEQIVKLRKIGSKDFQGQIAELERRISAAVAMEQRIAGHQSDEDIFHRKLRDKIDALEGRLGAFLASRQARATRIQELESKIISRLSTKTQKLTMVRDDIQKLEKMHSELEKVGKFKTKLQHLDERLHAMKEKLKELNASS